MASRTQNLPSTLSVSGNDINILLMGATGIGKTTFINALANYLVYGSMDEAIRGEMQALIPSSFTYTDSETFEDRSITIGEEDEYEKFSHEGQSATQHCRSFVFPIGDRKLRIIDTPGIGDTRGLAQDKKNLEHIFAYIAQFEYLNSVCILLKPGETRLTISFRFCVSELLRHLHRNVKDNLMFVFTHSKSTFYRPGSTKKLLQAILNDYRTKFDVTIPFNMSNSFLFDSEAFRFLALRKYNIELDEDLTLSYQKSWDQSVKECLRFLSRVLQCPLHCVSDMLSLNDAEQLIRKLPRPIAETFRLIEENIQLAEKFEAEVLTNPQLLESGLPQNRGRVRRLEFPQTVCSKETCCRVIDSDGHKRIEHIFICHNQCYLRGVDQEVLGDERLQDCSAMDDDTGNCSVCQCDWSHHRHITYEYIADRTHLKTHAVNNATNPDRHLSISDIPQHINALRGEREQIQNVYRKLAEFLHANALIPFNDAVVEYLQYFIQEEQAKKNCNADNQQIIESLEKTREEFQSFIELIQNTLQNRDKDERQNRSDIQPSEVATLIQSLYDLPITGTEMREQVTSIKLGQEVVKNRHERLVILPEEAQVSRVMVELVKILTAEPPTTND